MKIDAFQPYLARYLDEVTTRMKWEKRWKIIMQTMVLLDLNETPFHHVRPHRIKRAKLRSPKGARLKNQPTRDNILSELSKRWFAILVWTSTEYRLHTRINQLFLFFFKEDKTMNGKYPRWLWLIFLRYLKKKFMQIAKYIKIKIHLTVGSRPSSGSESQRNGGGERINHGQA